MKRPVLFVTLLFALSLITGASAQSYAARFDTAWRLVEERYWDLSRLPVDWYEIRPDFEARALGADDDNSFYGVLEEMYDLLGDNHSVYVPPSQVDEIRASYGDLPCLGVFSQRAGSERIGTVSFELLEGSVGYLQVPDLATTGVSQWTREAIRALGQSEPSGYILDLRGNPGGRLVEMMQMAGIFTRGFLWRTVTRWTLPLPYPAIGAIETEAPLVVLIDGGVNSAAEGLAGALQQRERATIVGERSAGNVEAVLPFCLRDGSQAWIATGVLAPIGGPTWEGVGVIPDIETSPQDALKAGLDLLLGR
jgi:carboxyl-terminal processing protease